ncbi:hypothetical protein KC865_00435 [Candidatus Kaiserbacteria bacterium]|nr:hypothetical protein [Candidatus Kaiserbacteria bacterium]USN91789.1 MAG: hypothetical protein H6782_02855 [Candidatus Nomurabacteria bacterium]
MKKIFKTMTAVALTTIALSFPVGGVAGEVCITCDNPTTLVDRVSFGGKTSAKGRSTFTADGNHSEFETVGLTDGYGMIEGKIGLAGGCDTPECARRTWEGVAKAGQIQSSTTTVKFNGHGSFGSTNRASARALLEVRK